MERKYFDLTRRRFIRSGLTVATMLPFQHAAVALGRAPNTDVCKLIPEQEQGPFYLADELLRSDIVEDKPGVPLSLRLVVLDMRTCTGLPNAAIDLWHCDALGLYSGFTGQNPMGPVGPGDPGGPRGVRPPGGPPTGFDPEHPDNHSGSPGNMGAPPENHPTDRLTFLRGIQLTGADGAVRFRTVFPGFYMGRTNHIHFKVRVGGREAEKSYQAGYTSHVGQIFFPEEIATELMKHEPYSRHAIHRTTQAEDGVFGGQHGERSIARLQALDSQKFATGLHAELVTFVDPAATPAAARREGGPQGPPPSE